MARRTDWQEKPCETYLGAGQRMLATDAGEYPLLEIRELVFETTDG
jgi:type VI secretion system protein ImpE